jgi:hypothetical protein
MAIDWRHQCLTLRVDPGRLVRGTFYTPHRWRLVRASSRRISEQTDDTPLATCAPGSE